MKILIIAPRFPFPIEKGDKLRLYHQIRVLSKSNSIILLALSDVFVDSEDIEHIKQFVEKVHIFRLYKPGILFNNFFKILSGLPLQVLYFYNRKIHSKIKKIIEAECPDVIYNQLIRTTEYSRNEKGFKVLDYMDAFSTGMHNRLDNSSFPFNWIYRIERDRLKAYEKAVFSDFQEHSIISRQDRDRIPVSDSDKIHIIPNGVETSFFKGKQKQKQYDICFVGNMGYRPNIVAAEFLCKEVLPLLMDYKDDLKVLLAGVRPHQRVKALENKQVRVSGWMEDIREAYDSSYIFVAPIFTGIGQQNKVLEAMSMELPCVCTSSVNNPIGAEEGREILIADDKNEFVKQILFLLENIEAGKEMGCEGRKMVLKNYSWEFQVNKLNEIFNRNDRTTG